MKRTTAIRTLQTVFILAACCAVLPAAAEVITVEIVEAHNSLDVEQPVRVELPAPKQVRRLGAKDDSNGHTQSFTVQTRPWQRTFVVLTDAPLDSPTLSPTQGIAVRGNPVRFRAAVPGALGLHALKLRVTMPDGSEAPWFDRSVVVGPEGADVQFSVALNEHLGAGTVTITDLYTNKTATAQLVVLE